MIPTIASDADWFLKCPAVQLLRVRLEGDMTLEVYDQYPQISSLKQIRELSLRREWGRGTEPDSIGTMKSGLWGHTLRSSRSSLSHPCPAQANGGAWLKFVCNSTCSRGVFLDWGQTEWRTFTFPDFPNNCQLTSLSPCCLGCILFTACFFSHFRPQDEKSSLPILWENKRASLAALFFLETAFLFFLLYKHLCVWLQHVESVL